MRISIIDGSGVVVYVCCCWNSNADDTSSEDRDVEMDQMDMAGSPKPDGADVAAVDSSAAAPTSAPGTKRLHYLENLKVFLTAIVVVSNSALAIDRATPEFFLGRYAYTSRRVASPLRAIDEGSGPFKLMVLGMLLLINLCLGALFFSSALTLFPRATRAPTGGEDSKQPSGGDF